ncbi:MAG: hypothetical protein KBF78_18975 [Fuscovulum sp.]|nr:hypothetical protein [Fuscovulum sp.]
MQMNHADFARSPALRASLKRGLARQAIAAADRCRPDLPGLIRMAAGLRPNPKGVERMAARIKAHPGVTRVTAARDGRSLTFIARLVRMVDARVGGDTVFHETGLIYLRCRVGMMGQGLSFELSAVGFCCHALERLVERSDLPLDRALLPQVDAEAQQILRSWDSGSGIVEDGDDYHAARTEGVWAGSHDLMALDPDWNLTNRCGRMPVFSARTFLSPAEMRPTVWLRWKNDPACRMT